MINKNQIELLSSVFNAKDIKEYIEKNIYAYLLFKNKVEHPKSKVLISVSPYSALMLFRGVNL